MQLGLCLDMHAYEFYKVTRECLDVHYHKLLKNWSLSMNNCSFPINALIVTREHQKAEGIDLFFFLES